MPAGSTLIAIKDGNGAAQNVIGVQNTGGAIASAVGAVDVNGNPITLAQDSTAAANITPLMTSVSFSTAVTGTITIIPAVAGKVIKVWGLLLSANGGTSVQVLDNATSVTSTGPLSFAQGTIMHLDPGQQPWLICGSGAALTLSQSGTATVGGRVYYTQS